ncbi:unnamed protein product [Scytosiphon promiscuus]
MPEQHVLHNLLLLMSCGSTALGFVSSGCTWAPGKGHGSTPPRSAQRRFCARDKGATFAPMMSRSESGPVATAGVRGGREVTWSNRKGEDLVQVSGDVWCAERPFVWNGIDVGGRMAVVKLSDGSLWVHSPVDLDGPLQEALAELGPVGHIVSPNYEHVKYAKQWVEAYPSARSYACPGLAERKPDVGFTREVGASPDDESPPEWKGEIQTCFMDCETNPFTGKPFFNEVVFFHRPTKSLMTSDLYWNYPREDIPFGTKVWKWGMDKVYRPFFNRFMVTDRGAFAVKVNQILGWGIETIVPCHGDVVRSGATEALRETLLGKGLE